MSISNLQTIKIAQKKNKIRKQRKEHGGGGEKVKGVDFGDFGDYVRTDWGQVTGMDMDGWMEGWMDIGDKGAHS